LFCLVIVRFKFATDFFHQLLSQMFFALKALPPPHWASGTPIFMCTAADVHQPCFYA